MSIQPILIRRKLGGAAAAPPAPVNAGELFFSVPGFISTPITAPMTESLWIDAGTGLLPLVDRNRQLEIVGNQTVSNGVKTFTGLGGIALATLANMGVGDGTPGQIIQKGAGNAIVWGTAAAATVLTDGVTIQGDGLVATEIALMPSVFGAGLTWTPNSAVVNVATTAQIATGTLGTAFVTPAGLRTQLGADAATLLTTAKTVVPAINEVITDITALVGVVIFAGSYNATTNIATFNGQGGIPAGATPLPPASAANHGAYVIVTTAGTGTPPAPAVPIGVGDWLVSTGTAWQRLPFSQTPLTAANVGVVPPVAGGSNVQDALTNLETQINTAAFYDPTTFGGDALSLATQLTLTVVDGGTF